MNRESEWVSPVSNDEKAPGGVNARFVETLPLLVSLIPGGVLLGAATFFGDERLHPGFTGIGLAIIFAALSYWGLGRLLSGAMTRAQLQSLIASDRAPCVLSDPGGRIVFRNDAAVQKFPQTGSTVSELLKNCTGDPNSAQFRLQKRAQMTGAAREDFGSANGLVRVSVAIPAARCLVWRMEDFGKAGRDLQSMNGGSIPRFIATQAGTVLFMNDAMRHLIDVRVRALDMIFETLPPRQMARNRVLSKDGPLDCTVFETEVTGGRREFHLLPDTVSDRSVPLARSAVLGELPVALLEIAPGGVIVSANRRADEMLLCGKRNSGELLGDLVGGPGRPIRDWLDDAFNGRGLDRPETLRAKRGDGERYVCITLSAHGGGLVAVLTDATQLKTLEAQFVQSQKMQAIGQLAGGIAHDFNNLLTAIAGHCDLLLSGRAADDPEFADLRQIQANVDRAACLVRQLLAYSRQQTLKTEVLDIADVLHDCAQLLSRLVGGAFTLNMDCQPGLLPVRSDRNQLEQVLMNLVVNARQAMPEGGEISVTACSQQLDRPMRRDNVEVPEGAYVLIRVVDQGAGIAPEILPRIFEPFFTTKKTGEGTGLGLSMVYGIVKQTGGYIFADSAIGSGTGFSIYLPALEQPPAVKVRQEERTATAMEAVVEPRESGVVLLVEDEDPVRAFAARALRMCGFDVLEANCAEQALRILEDESLDVDVFLTDVVMPGLDGPGWVRKALGKRPNARVIFVSGYADDVFGDGKEGISNSVFLPKPFSLQQLASVVRGQLQ